MRSGPGLEHKKVDLLDIGDEVRILSRTGEWLEIEGKEGNAAFVYAPLIAADRLEPKCPDVEKEQSCWVSMVNIPECYYWGDKLDARETLEWSGTCIDGKPSGKGKLTVKLIDENAKRTVTLEYEDMIDGRGNGRYEQKSSLGGHREGFSVYGKLYGPWTIKYDDGGSAEGLYVNGERQGKWTIKYSNGGSAEGLYVNGERRGKWTIKYSNGGSSEGSYVNGKEHGTWTEFFSNGDQLVYKYRNGSRSGQKGTYYRVGMRYGGFFSEDGNCFRGNNGELWAWWGDKSNCTN